MKHIATLLMLVCLVGCTQRQPESTTPSATQPNAGVWRSVVVSVREPESGMCSLVADSSLCKSERAFKFVSLWKYDADSARWSRVKPDLSSSALIRPAATGRQPLLELTRELGLFWAWFEEDGRRIGTLVYSGTILPNDLRIGPDKPGFIRTGIPYADHAKAAYVPDPKLHCK